MDMFNFFQVQKKDLKKDEKNLKKKKKKNK